MTKRFATQYNDLRIKDPERNTKPSMTVPDMTMSIKEILQRFAKGIPISGEKVPIYDGDEDFFPDVNNMDLADRQAFIEDSINDIKETRAKFERKKQENQEQQRIAQQDAIKKKKKEREEAAALRQERSSKKFAARNNDEDNDDDQD